VMKAKEQGKPCSPEEFENCGYTSVDDFTLTRVYHVDGDASVVIFESSSVEDKDYYPIRQLGGVSQDSILAIGGKNNNIWKLVDGEFLVVKSCNAASATNTIFYKFLQSAPDEFFLFGGTSGSNKIYRLNWASCSEEDLPGDNYSLIKFLKTGTDDIWALSRTTGSYQGEVVLLHRAYQDN